MAIDAAQLRVIVSADTSKAESELKSFSGSMKNAAGGMAAVGGILSATIAAPLIGIGVSAIKTAASFEKSMNVLEYVTGATGDTMQKMQDQALQLGADTVFSAGEAAEGMVELAKAGMEVEDVMGAIPGVMDLAAAGQVSVAEAAGLTAATLATFSLEAEESTRVADILAAAANASTADVADLAFGVKNAGAVFAANGVKVETLATLMAILANNGIDASDAATSLKTMHMRLTAPTDKAAAVMRRMGIAVYDANGNMRDYGEIIGDMEDATKGMTQAQKDAAYATVFGADAIRAANILTKEGVAGYDEMMVKVLETGAAAEMAAAQNGGLEGSLNAIAGSLETLQIKLALPFLETLAEWTDQLATFVNGLGDLPPEVTSAALAFTGFAGAIGLAMAAIGGGMLLLAPLGGTVGLITLAVLGLAAAAAVLWVAWNQNWGDIQGKLEPLTEAFVTAGYAVQDIGWYLATAAAEGDVFNTWLLSVPPALIPLAEGMARVIIAAQDFGTQLSNLGSYLLQVVLTGAALNIWLFTMTPAMANFALALANGILAIQDFGTAISTAITAADMPTFDELFADLLAGDFGGLTSKLQQALDKLILNLKIQFQVEQKMAQAQAETEKAVAAAGLAAGAVPAQVADSMTTAIEAHDWEQTGFNIGTTIKDALVKSIKEAPQREEFVQEKLDKFEKEPFGPLVADISNLGSIFADAFSLTFDATAVAAKVQTTIASAKQMWQDLMTGIMGSIMEPWHPAITKGPDPILSQQKNLMGADLTWDFMFGQVELGFTSGIATATANIFTGITGFWAEVGAQFATAMAPWKEQWKSKLNELFGTEPFGTEESGVSKGKGRPRPELAESRQEGLVWAEFVLPLMWSEFIPQPLIWDTFLQRLEWATFIAFVEWGTFIPELSWGNYVSTVDWGRYIPTAPIPAANASGTPYFRGGATWVGEEGPELVTLPQGARIYSNDESMAMAGGGTTINVFVDSINSGLDIEQLAAQLARRFQQKMRS